MKITISFTISDRTVLFIRKVLNKKILILLLILLSATVVYTASQNVGDLVQLTNGDTVFADPINKNFQDLYNKINEIKNVDLVYMNNRLNSTDLGSDSKPIGIIPRYQSSNSEIDAMITQLENGSIQKGMIAMWSGDPTALPPNWTLCDGEDPNEDPIPDLRDKFVVGASKEKGINEHLYLVNDSDDSPTHDHDIMHTHEDVKTDVADEHSHEWVNFNKSIADWSSGESPHDYSSNSRYIYLTESDGSDDGFFPFMVPENSPYSLFYTTNYEGHDHTMNLENSSQQQTDGMRSTAEGVMPRSQGLYYIIKYQ